MNSYNVYYTNYLLTHTLKTTDLQIFTLNERKAAMAAE